MLVPGTSRPGARQSIRVLTGRRIAVNVDGGSAVTTADVLCKRAEGILASIDDLNQVISRAQKHAGVLDQMARLRLFRVASNGPDSDLDPILDADADHDSSLLDDLDLDDYQRPLARSGAVLTLSQTEIDEAASSLREALDSAGQFCPAEPNDAFVKELATKLGESMVALDRVSDAARMFYLALDQMALGGESASNVLDLFLTINSTSTRIYRDVQHWLDDDDTGTDSPLMVYAALLSQQLQKDEIVDRRVRRLESAVAGLPKGGRLGGAHVDALTKGIKSSFSFPGNFGFARQRFLLKQGGEGGWIPDTHVDLVNILRREWRASIAELVALCKKTLASVMLAAPVHQQAVRDVANTMTDLVSTTNQLVVDEAPAGVGLDLIARVEWGVIAQKWFTNGDFEPDDVHMRRRRHHM
jgi:hypothetical protein